MVTELAEGYTGVRERMVHDMTNRLALGNTTIGFGLGGMLAVLFITLSHVTVVSAQATSLPLIFALGLSGATAALCSGRGKAASLSLGTGFLLPGLAVALLLSPRILGRMSAVIGPWELLFWAAVFASSFALAGALAALLHRQGLYWVKKSSLGFGIGGAAGGGVLAVVLLSMQRFDGLNDAGLTSYIGSICLAVFIACTVGGTRLDAERRVSVRVAAEVPCSLTVVNPRPSLSAEQLPVDCLCRDLSLGGIVIEADSPLMVGDVVSIQLELDQRRPTRALARVAREGLARNGMHSYGLELLRLEDWGQRELTRFYISRERRGHPRRGFVVVAVTLILLLLGGVSLEAYRSVDEGRQLLAASFR